MKDVVEIFFGLAVGLPLAVIGLIGVFAIIGSSVASAMTLFPRGRTGQAVGVLLIVAMVVLMVLDVVPVAQLTGVPLLGVAAVMTFVAHQRLARHEDARRSDVPIAILALAGLVAVMVPVFIMMASGFIG